MTYAQSQDESLTQYADLGAHLRNVGVHWGYRTRWMALGVTPEVVSRPRHRHSYAPLEGSVFDAAPRDYVRRGFRIQATTRHSL